MTHFTGSPDLLSKRAKSLTLQRFIPKVFFFFFFFFVWELSFMRSCVANNHGEGKEILEYLE
jgi:hypothetical protein